MLIVILVPKKWWTGFVKHTRIDVHFPTIFRNIQLHICSITYSYRAHHCLQRKVCWNVLPVDLLIGTGSEIFISVHNYCSQSPYFFQCFMNLINHICEHNYFSSLWQVIIEIPYIFLQVGIFVIITYPAISFYWSVDKVFWYFFTMFCTMLYYTYLGMLLVSTSRSLQVATVMASFSNTIMSLFSGFLIPEPVSHSDSTNLVDCCYLQSEF